MGEGSAPLPDGGPATRTNTPPERPLVLDSPIGLVLGGRQIKGTILNPERELGRASIVLGADTVWKVYRLTELEPAALERVRREADIATAVRGIDGVVGANAVGEVDEWLVIQMQRMPGSLGDHLADRQAGRSPRRSAAEYGDLLADTAATLTRLHRRGIVHRDVKPGNLLFSSDGSRLLVCDFSVARGKRSTMTRTGTTLGTDSYIAPEQLRGGEATPAGDQYSLAVVAREVFGGRDAPGLPRPLADVLHTGTAGDPEDRFPGVSGAEDFGRALVRALKDELPRTATERLRDASPRIRFAYAPTLVAFLACWLIVVLRRDPDVGVPVETLILPIGFAVATFAVTFATNGARMKRTRSGWTLLDQWWVPALILLAIWIPLHSKIHSFGYLIFVPVLTTLASIGAFPMRTGYWLPATVERVRGLRAGWVRLVSVATVGVLALAAPVVGHLAPAGYDGPTAVNSVAVQIVSNYRRALAANSISSACRLVRATAQTPCTTWAAAERVGDQRQLSSLRAAMPGVRLFDDTALDSIELRKEHGTAPGGGSVYELAEPHSSSVAARRRVFGILVLQESVAFVGITAGPAKHVQDFYSGAKWLYRVSEVNGVWRIEEVKFCTAGADAIEGGNTRRCATPMQLTAAQAQAEIAGG